LTAVSRYRYRFGAWAVAFAFGTVLGFTTVPTPLWSLYAERDGYSTLTVTILFAVYAVGVAASLFLVGHLSDWHGRRRVLVPALLINVLAGIIFVAWPHVTGLLIARVLSGLGIGAVNATATAWLIELHTLHGGAAGRRRAEVVAVAANLGGLGLGALISGVLAQWAGDPLAVPFLVYTAALVIAVSLVLSAPETRRPIRPTPKYRPQRFSVPAESRGRYFAAATAAMIAFALLGLFSSLAPGFLAQTLHQPSRALAGAVCFAGFAAAALAQVLTGSRTVRELLSTAIPAMLIGPGMLVLAVWLPDPSLGLFGAGVLVTGVGCGLTFKGSVATVSALASPDKRAEALAGVFLAAYLGLAGPIIGLGLLTQVLTARMSLLIFVGLLASGIIAAAPKLLGLDHGTLGDEAVNRRGARVAQPCGAEAARH
jgi:MFS family permease